MRKEEKKSTSLDTIETSVHFSDTYRERLLTDFATEYPATYEMYHALDKFGSRKRTATLEQCRTFAYFVINKETRRVKIAANACRLRWCPICAKAKSISVSGSIIDYLAKKKNAKFLTLTLKHSAAELSFQIHHLYAAFKELRRLKIWKKNCRGGVWFFQVKKSKKDGLWHPHLHCILDSKFMSQPALADKWLKITKTSSIVDIRQIYNPEKIANYVARYASRPSNLDELTLDGRLELFQAMHGRRLCGKWGNAKDIDLSGQHKPIQDETIKCCRYEKVVKDYKLSKRLKILYDCWQNELVIPMEYELNYFMATNQSIQDENDMELIIDEVFSYG